MFGNPTHTAAQAGVPSRGIRRLRNVQNPTSWSMETKKTPRKTPKPRSNSKGTSVFALRGLKGFRGVGK